MSGLGTIAVVILSVIAAVACQWCARDCYRTANRAWDHDRLTSIQRYAMALMFWAYSFAMAGFSIAAVWMKVKP